MSIGLKSLIAGTALSVGLAALVLGLATLTDQPSMLSVKYLGGGSLVFGVALRTLLPKTSFSRPRPEATPTRVSTRSAKLAREEVSS